MVLDNQIGITFFHLFKNFIIFRNKFRNGLLVKSCHNLGLSSFLSSSSYLGLSSLFRLSFSFVTFFLFWGRFHFCGHFEFLRASKFVRSSSFSGSFLFSKIVRTHTQTDKQRFWHYGHSYAPSSRGKKFYQLKTFHFVSMVEFYLPRD